MNILILACAIILATAPAALACEKDLHAGHGMSHAAGHAKGHVMDHANGHGMDHSPAAPTAGDSASTQELKAANMAMHKEMDITYTHDADVDFLKGMIAHHQGAVEMAQVQLKYGKNPQVKRLAQDIIRSQNLEIRWMSEWLAQLEKKPLTFSDTPTGSGLWNDSKWNGEDGVWMGER